MPKTLFVTGKLAEPALRATLERMAPEFPYEVAVLRITVAALMTTSWIARHLSEVSGCERIVIPGLCEGDVRVIEDRWGVRTEKGPADLRDLPEHFGQAALREEYGAHDIRIFAEINNVPYLSREEVVRLAEYYRQSGADVDRPRLLPRPEVRRRGRRRGPPEGARASRLSIDTLDPRRDRRRRPGGRRLRAEPQRPEPRRWPPGSGPRRSSSRTPRRISTRLDRSIAHLETLGRPYIVDPVIEPVGFGFAAALDRYVQVRARHPAAEMLMGIGNITELTDADTTGMNALLIGFCQELGIRHVLTTEVIPWARGAVREVDVARRLMYAARQRGVLPKHIDDRLLTVKDARPKYYTEAELRALHQAITDPNFRIATTRDAICVFNNRLFVSGTDIQALFEQLGVEDPGPRLLPRQGADEGAPGAPPREDLRAGAAAPLGIPDAGARGDAPPPRADRGAPTFARRAPP